MSKNLSIVLVDESKCVIAQLLKLIAGTEGVEVVGTAGDGSGALHVVGDLNPDLVLMDTSMSGVDGMSALRVLRSKYPEVRIVMMSSLEGVSSCAEEAFRLGAIQVIGKPFDADLLTSLFEGERKARGFSSRGGDE